VLTDREPPRRTSGGPGVVQRLTGVDNLVVAGSYGYDALSSEGGAIERKEDTSFAGLLGRFTDTVCHQVASVERALAEPKRFLGALARCA
jgi:trehalose 6-phosphate phosphatase